MLLGRPKCVPSPRKRPRSPKTHSARIRVRVGETDALTCPSTQGRRPARPRGRTPVRGATPRADRLAPSARVAGDPDF